VVYLFATEYLNHVDERLTRALLTHLLAPGRMLRFSPASTWLEYTVAERGQLRDIALLNHGRLRLPAGTGRDAGPWQGTVTFDRAPLGLPDQPLELQRVRFDCATDRMSLEPVPLLARPGTLAARLNVDSREELVLGPAGEAARLFFADSTCGEATR
jgi:hypothetical protein